MNNRMPGDEKNPEMPRPNMVAIAVKFLENPKVKDSHRKEKTSFLKRKGLTQEEIDIAFEQVGDSGLSESHHQPHPNKPVESGPSEVSALTRLREHFMSFVVIGGVGYAIYKFFQVYILPYFWEDPVQKRLEALEQRQERHLQAVEETLTAVREMVTVVKDEIQNQNTKLDTFMRQYGCVDPKSMDEVKSGITTLKGLLLNRRQFPPTPVSQPIIPSWQRESPPHEGRVSPLSSRSNSPQLENFVKPSSSVDVSPSRSDVTDGEMTSLKTSDDVKNAHDAAVNANVIPTDDVIKTSDDVIIPEEEGELSSVQEQ